MAQETAYPTVIQTLKSVERRAVVCAFGVWLTVVTAFALQIESPWWGAMAAFRVSLRDRDGSEYMRRNRFLGTAIGCGVGFVLAGLIVDSHAFIIVATFLLAVVGTYRRFTAAAAYGWLLGAASAMLVINAAIYEPGDTFNFFIYRTLETFIAVSAIGILDRCFLPRTGVHRYHTVPTLSEDDRREVAIVALAAGTTVVVISTVWVTLDLPQGLQVLVTTLAVYNTSVEAQKAKSFRRFSGVIFGGLVGLMVVALSIESFLVWSFVFLFFMTAFAGYATSARPDSYAGVQAGYGFLVAMVTGNGPVAELLPVLERMFGITFGVIIAYIVLLCIYSLFGKDAK